MTVILICLIAILFGEATGLERLWPQYEKSPFVIEMEIPAPEDSQGGVVAADLDGDGRPDFLVTVPGHIAAYANDGSKLWILETPLRIAPKSEEHGLPGHHGPGVQVADVDADGETEVLFLTYDSFIHAVNGKTGEEEWAALPIPPDDAERWEHLVIANFRGQGDRDLLLQATNRKGYRMGRYLGAYSIDDLAIGKIKPLWERDDFLGCAHNGARVADLDLDGRDEVLGGTLVSFRGKILYSLPELGDGAHLDAIYAADLRPDFPGIEVVALEERNPNRVFVYGMGGLIWESHFKHQEPQNAGIGEFDLGSSGLEIWCRSRYNKNQKPFVFDARGRKIFDYELNKVKPKGWTDAGVEVINRVDWSGKRKQLIVAKERHRSGHVGLFDPMSGEFKRRFKTKADRLYVADVSGDWREEIIVQSGNQLRIYFNKKQNPNPGRDRLWVDNAYLRSKMTWNYYSP
jgi:outer membrane protein assembly factor BamB